MKRSFAYYCLIVILMASSISVYAEKAKTVVTDSNADLTDHNIVDALKSGKIGIEIRGSGINSVALKIKRLVNHPIKVVVPAGTYFICKGSAQNMVSLRQAVLVLDSADYQENIYAACANRSRAIPDYNDTFGVQISSHQEELEKLIPVLINSIGAYAVDQAAVWIVTDDADYADLGTLVSGNILTPFARTRAIGCEETAMAMKICFEAGIDIRFKNIWKDRNYITSRLKNGNLIKWISSIADCEGVKIDSLPDQANVQIDGESVGTTPIRKELSTLIEHSIVISLEGYYPENRKIILQSGEIKPISIVLVERPKGTLEVKAKPEGAKIQIDGKSIGMVPYIGSITADEEHIVQIEAKGYYITEPQKITIAPNETRSISISLESIKSQIGKDDAEMILIPAGEFQMGSNDGYGESPIHTVYLDAFYIDKYEVTNAQYKKFMDATGHKAPFHWNDSHYNDPKQPVAGVSWNDAKAYADWAGKRLPTEAEWEKAARGGLSGKKYPWGDIITHDNANYGGFGGKDRWDFPAPIGSFAANVYGLYDIAGNVEEWCADWYDSNYYANSPKSNPKGPDSGKKKVIRGGTNGSIEEYLQVANRRCKVPTLCYGEEGFRCVQ